MSLPRPRKSIGPWVPATITLPVASTATFAALIGSAPARTCQASLIEVPAPTYFTRSSWLSAPDFLAWAYPAAYTAPSGPVATALKPSLPLVA